MTSLALRPFMVLFYERIRLKHSIWVLHLFQFILHFVRLFTTLRSLISSDIYNIYSLVLFKMFCLLLVTSEHLSYRFVVGLPVDPGFPNLLQQLLSKGCFSCMALGL